MPEDTTIQKVIQTAEFYRNLGIKTMEKADEVGNIKLMKLLYLFFMEYVRLNDNQLPQHSSFNNYHFFAFQHGPVEKEVYALIGSVKYFLSYVDKRVGNVWDAYPEENVGLLDRALQAVRNNYWGMTTNQIIDFTHFSLSKWMNTPMGGEMVFTGNDYKVECSGLLGGANA